MPRIARFLRASANAVGGGLFLALFLVFAVQVLARFGFDRPLPWSDELAVVLYVWIILWACAFMVPTREHVMFDLLWQAASRQQRCVMRAVGHLMIGSLSLWALPACWDYVSFMSRDSTPVLGIPFYWVFLPFVFLLMALVVRAIFGLHQVWRGEGLDDVEWPS